MQRNLRGARPVAGDHPLATGEGEDELATQATQPERGALGRGHIHKIGLNAMGSEVAAGDRHHIARTNSAIFGADGVLQANGNSAVGNQTLKERKDGHFASGLGAVMSCVSVTTD